LDVEGIIRLAKRWAAAAEAAEPKPDTELLATLPSPRLAFYLTLPVDSF